MSLFVLCQRIYKYCAYFRKNAEQCFVSCQLIVLCESEMLYSSCVTRFLASLLLCPALLLGFASYVTQWLHLSRTSFFSRVFHPPKKLFFLLGFKDALKIWVVFQHLCFSSLSCLYILIETLSGTIFACFRKIKCLIRFFSWDWFSLLYISTYSHLHSLFWCSLVPELFFIFFPILFLPFHFVWVKYNDELTCMTRKGMIFPLPFSKEFFSTAKFPTTKKLLISNYPC